MPSQFWDEERAERYKGFRYEFPEKTLAGRTVIVAGGTGGLGAATAALLAREGAAVVAGFRSNRARAETLQRAIEEQFGQKISLVGGDISKAETRRAFLDAVQKTKTPLAGAAIFPGDPARVAFDALDRDALLSGLEANYVGPLLLAKEIGQAMEQSDEGSIVLLASMQAVGIFPSSLNYAVSKAALVHAARILAQQWRRVRVNVVAPGATMAGMGAESIRSGKYDKYVENGAITRFGHPEDVARAVRFFLEPGGYATGQLLVADGGLTLRRDRG